MIELTELYKTNKVFKEYTDKYATCHRMLPEDALKTITVKNAAEYYTKGDK